MCNVLEKSDSDNEAPPPQLNGDWAIHNEIWGGFSGGHVLSNTIVEFRACKSRSCQHMSISVQDTVA